MEPIKRMEPIKNPNSVWIEEDPNVSDIIQICNSIPHSVTTYCLESWDNDYISIVIAEDKENTEKIYFLLKEKYKDSVYLHRDSKIIQP